MLKLCWGVGWLSLLSSQVFVVPYNISEDGTNMVMSGSDPCLSLPRSWHCLQIVLEHCVCLVSSLVTERGVIYVQPELLGTPGRAEEMRGGIGDQCPTVSCNAWTSLYLTPPTPHLSWGFPESCHSQTPGS